MTDTVASIGSNASWTLFRDAIREERSFQNSGKTLYGEFMPATYTSGCLNNALREKFHDSWKHGGIDYVIYSYGTPIAWRAWGMWKVPDEKYSVTTSKHQGRIRTAIAEL